MSGDFLSTDRKEALDDWERRCRENFARMRERDGVWPDSDREADIERQQLLRRIVLCRNAEMIEDARGIVDRDCLYELLQYYWKLNTWERKCCLVDLIQDQLRLRQGMSDPDIEKVAVDVLRAPGWGMDHIDYPKIWAMTFLTDRDYFEIEREELYADAEKELGKRGLELAGPRAPLIEAILKGRLDDALALLREGADPNVKRDTDGRCALQWAVIYGMVDLVKTLLDLGADPNARDAWDRTPLMEAVPSHKSEIVRLLLARGADPHAVDKIAGRRLAVRAQPQRPTSREPRRSSKSCLRSAPSGERHGRHSPGRGVVGRRYPRDPSTSALRDALARACRRRRSA